MGERCTVEGTVQSVIFQNEENGYTVLSLAVDGQEEPVTVVGCIPCAAPGEELILTGRYTTHPQHGEQFAADEVERHMPTGETEILNYLASGVVRGIGPATAQKLVDEACRVARSCGGPRPRARDLLHRGAPALWCSVGAGGIALIWLISALI